MMKKYKIAGLVVGLDPKFEPYKTQVKPYEYDGDENSIIDIEITEDDFKKLENKYTVVSRKEIEYLFSGSAFYTLLLKFGGMMLHSSAVMLDNEAYLFSAPSGVGKSTHTALWCKEFPSAEIINDDKPALKIENGDIYVYGTPWSGNSDKNINTRCHLKGICFLKRGAENKIKRITPKDAIPLLYEGTVRSSDKRILIVLLEVMDAILNKVPIYSMECNMDKEAAHIAYKMMSKGEN